MIPRTGHPAIHRGIEWNRLAAIAVGDSLRLFVNGEQVGEARDDRRPWGDLVWFAESQARDRPVEVQFANLVVSVPGPVETLGPVLHGQ